MKSIFSLIISAALIVSGYSQTRNVLVGANNSVVQPTNFWSADASNARTGLGLGSAATNPASAFQPSSTVLSNIASSNAANLTNLRATNLVGIIPSSNIPTVSLTNISGTLAISSGGTGATNASTARTNFGLGWPALTNSNAATMLLGHEINGIVIYTNTNALTFSNSVKFLRYDGLGDDFLTIEDGRSLHYFGEKRIDVEEMSFSPSVTVVDNLESPTNLFVISPIAAVTRTNLGLGATWLTNTNVTNFLTDLGLGWPALTNTNAGTGLVSVNTNGEVVSPTNFWQVAPINTRVQLSQPVVNATNAATNARNLYLYSLAISTTGVTNTITLPTNSLVFLGDVATVIHDGPTSSVTAIRQIGSATNLITLNQVREAVKFIYESDGWRLADNISYVEPIYFSGTNASANAAVSRTNLGIPSSFGTTTLSAIGGGQSNVAQRNYGVVGGGLQNVNIGFSSVIGGGSVNTILEGTVTLGSVIGGGNSNTINGSSYSVIGGGRFNTNGGTADFGSFIGGGYFNTIDGSYSVVGGGAYNTAGSNYATVIGGLSNSATALYSLAAGLMAKATNNGSFVWADSQNSDFSSTNINSFNVRASGGMSLDLGTNGIIFRTDASAAVTRTNLGLGATNDVTFSNVTASGTLTATSTVTAKTNLVVEGFVDYTAARTNNSPTNAGNFGDHARWIEVKIGTNSFFLPAYQ